ncbi:MAG: NHLP bacteriocin export ABC transporter permease/ATPase subunit [Clostridia bacterium]
MGWFDEQIRQRIQQDEEGFSDAFDSMSAVIMGRRHLGFDREKHWRTEAAVDEILKYYHVKPQQIPEGIDGLQEQLEYLLRPSGIMRRSVELTDGWYKDCIGAILAETADDGMVALLPSGLNGYTYYDYKAGKSVRINSKTAEFLTGAAVCFYKPLPLKKLGIPDLLRYILSTLSVWDFVMAAVATLAVTMIGLLLPYINNLIFDKVIVSGQLRLLMPISCLLVGVTISSLLIGITKSMVEGRLSSKTDVAVEAAAMMRMLSLPAGFFKQYSAGELNNRVSSIRSLCSTLSDAVLTTGLTSVFSLVYIGQIFRYAPSLVIPALTVILVTVLVSVGSSLLQMKISEQRMELSAKGSGLVFALISGVQKIKLAGAEKRAFSRWAHNYTKSAKLQYDPPILIKLNGVLTMAITLLGTIAIYYFAAVNQISVADYMAFNVSYGMVSGAISALAGIALTVADIRPVMKLVEPILDTVPEVAEDKKMVTKLSGGLELNNVSFRYNDDMPMVLDDLSIKIRAGEYIAIVGRTGCGKSTLIRLLLGFEKPLKGAVYYDGRDITTLDLKSLRRNIGVVLQDGKLFPGDIFSNITISAPWLSMEEAWTAARMSGVEEDIKRMPMGMHTLISGGSGGISGGQAQRLMIARAIAGKPRILIFDEATSALDNITQRQVSESLDSLKCTRIVVAHRLSTIRQCNRILVLNGGKIVQDGTYEQLINDAGGLFAELVKRQRLDVQQIEGAPPDTVQ